MINESIAKLVKYGENAGLVSGLDKIYATNRILEVMQISDYEEPEQIPETPDLEETLNELLDDAAKRGLLEHNSVVYRDLFDTKLMDCLMPRPGEVVKKFEELYAKSPQEATDYFYKLSQDSNYIRRYRIAKDIRWSVPSAYGDIDISINLSKPERIRRASRTTCFRMSHRLPSENSSASAFSVMTTILRTELVSAITSMLLTWHAAM